MTPWRFIFIALLALLVTPTAAAGADDGPVVIAHRDRHPILTLDPFRGSIGLTEIRGQLQEDVLVHLERLVVAPQAVEAERRVGRVLRGWEGGP